MQLYSCILIKMVAKYNFLMVQTEHNCIQTPKSGILCDEMSAKNLYDFHLGEAFVRTNKMVFNCWLTI